MKLVEYHIKDESGLHARPASKLAQSLQKYKSSVMIEYEGKTANAKSIINLMSLGIAGRFKVTFKIEGEDEEALAASIVDILSEHGI